jgi:hypothetical protein
MALLDSEAIPVKNATPTQLRALGGALAEWARCECADTGVLHFISREALANLANGNPPPPFLEQYQEMRNENRALTGDITNRDPQVQAKERHQLRQEMGDAGLRRIVYFQLRGTYATRKKLFANLRAAIPADLVEDVRVSDWSWEA